MLKKIIVKNWTLLSKISFISFRGRMLKSKNFKMGTSSKAQFTLTVRTVSVYIANWTQLVTISFSSAERVAKRYSKNQNIFVGFSEC